MKKKQSNLQLNDNIQRLNDYQHARLRTEMYLGSRTPNEQTVLLFGDNSFKVTNLTWVPALITSLREIFDNAADEHIKANTKDPIIRVMYDEETMTFEVSDNGRGIPIDYIPDVDKNLCTMVLTEMKTGRNFNDDERQNVIGMNGLGGSVVMVVSEKAEIDIQRSGKPYKDTVLNDEYNGMYKFTQKFTEGNDVLPDLQIFDPVIRKIKSDKSGTTVKCTISKKVFPSLVLPTELIYSMLKEIANANPDFKIFLNNQRINVKSSTEKNLFNMNKAMTLSVKDDGFDSEFFIIPNVVTDQAINFHMQGLVNNAPTFDGGTHLDTFKKGFSLGVISALEKESKRRKMKPNRSDIEEGLLIYNITKMNAPSFNSQTKTRLTNDSVVKPIQNAMSVEYFAELVKKNKEWVEEIFTRCAERTNKKDADEDRKAAKKLIKGKVAKLRDAVGKDRSKCELFLTEGDCLEIQTPIVTIGENGYEDKEIGDIKVGDLVLTHNNNIKPVLSKNISVLNTIKFSTPLGDVVCTENHKMMVMRDNEFIFIEAKHIKMTDKFVRSQLVDMTYVDMITKIIDIDDEVYDLEITLQSGNTVKSSNDHSFMVYDEELMSFTNVKCAELITGKHSVLIK